jgi:Flp pilus assembly protein TadG
MKKMKHERGQSLVELSISLVMLLLLLSGAVEFGMAFFQFVQLRDAAQEGALYGSMNPSQITNIQNRVKGSSSSPINLSGSGVVAITISIDGVPSSDGGYSALDCEGHGLKVQVVYQHKIFMPFIPQVLNRTHIPLTASVTDTILSPVTC